MESLGRIRCELKSTVSGNGQGRGIGHGFVTCTNRQHTIVAVARRKGDWPAGGMGKLKCS